MAEGLQSIKETFIHEGKIAIDNDDNGGITYLGIAYNFHPTWSGWKVIFPVVIKVFKELGHIITTSDLKNIGTRRGKVIFNHVPKTTRTKINSRIPKSVTQLAVLFYKKKFWDTINGDNCISQSFAESMFDFGVNTGTPYTKKLVQRLIGVKADGIFGKGSVYGLNCKILDNHHKLHTQFACLKVLKYIKIVTHPKQAHKKKYIFGWLKRTLNIYFGAYDLKAIEYMISCTDGDRGPYNSNGYTLFLEDDNHRDNLKKLVEVYRAVKIYKKDKKKESLISRVKSQFPNSR